MNNSQNKKYLNIAKKCNICDNYDRFGYYYYCPNVKWKCYTCSLENQLISDDVSNYCNFCSKVIAENTEFLLENNQPIHVSCKKRYDRGIFIMESKDLQNHIIPINKPTNIWKNDDNLNCKIRCDCCLKIIHYENSTVWQLYNEESHQGLIYYINSEGTKYVYKQDKNISICFDCFRDIKFKDSRTQLSDWKIDEIDEPIHKVLENSEINSQNIFDTIDIENSDYWENYTINYLDSIDIENSDYEMYQEPLNNNTDTENIKLNNQYLNFDGKKDSKQELDYKKALCCICQDKEPNIIMVPCGHLCLCKNCIIGSEEKSITIDKCPICRKKGSKMQVYLP